MRVSRHSFAILCCFMGSVAIYSLCCGRYGAMGLPSPTHPRTFRLFSSVVEHPPCKRRVTSSNLVRGSTTVANFAILQWKNLIRFRSRSVIYHLYVGDRPLFVPLFIRWLSSRRTDGISCLLEVMEAQPPNIPALPIFEVQ